MIIIDSSTDATVTAAFGDDTQVIVVDDVTKATADIVKAFSKLGSTAIEATENLREIARAIADLYRSFIEQPPGFLSDTHTDQCKIYQAPTRDRRGHASDRRRRWSRWTYGLG